MTNMTTEVSWCPSGVMLPHSQMAPVGTLLEDGIVTKNAHIMTPDSAAWTHYFYCNSRNYRTDDAEYFVAITAGLAVVFGSEDKPMIEAQQARIGRSDLLDCAPALLPIDNASTRARRICRRLAQAEQDAASLVPP
jgi:vanillate O-demethylase monooxygenase subunit